MSDSTHQDLIPELDRSGLRNFGLLTGVIIVTLFGLVFPWLLDLGFVYWPWIVASVLWLPALIAPQSLRIFYRGWMRFGLIMSRITTPIILGIVFFVVITPVALIMKLASRDPLRRVLQEDVDSYRIESTKSERDRIERPY